MSSFASLPIHEKNSYLQFIIYDMGNKRKKYYLRKDKLCYNKSQINFEGWTHDMLKKIAFTLLGIILIYAAVAFALKAGIGVLPVDAAITSIATVIDMKVGTFSILFHGSFFVGQVLIEKKNFRKMELLQIPYLLLGGSILNFFLYTVLKNVSFHLYPVRVIVCILAFITAAFGCVLILETHLMKTPMEGFIQLVAERMGTTMGKLRQKIDIFLVILCVGLTLIFHTDWTIREGTLIAMIIFGPTMDFIQKCVFRRYKS